MFDLPCLNNFYCLIKSYIAGAWYKFFSYNRLPIDQCRVAGSGFELHWFLDQDPNVLKPSSSTEVSSLMFPFDTDYIFLAGMPLSKPQKPDPVFKCWIRIWIRMERLRIRKPKLIFSELFISFIHWNYFLAINSVFRKSHFVLSAIIKMFFDPQVSDGIYKRASCLLILGGNVEVFSIIRSVTSLTYFL